MVMVHQIQSTHTHTHTHTQRFCEVLCKLSSITLLLNVRVVNSHLKVFPSMLSMFTETWESARQYTNSIDFHQFS